MPSKYLGMICRFSRMGSTPPMVLISASILFGGPHHQRLLPINLLRASLGLTHACLCMFLLMQVYSIGYIVNEI